MKQKDLKISAKERFHLKQFIKNLEHFRGRGTELVSVYVPAGYELSKITHHLSQEQGTATNIKSSSTRKNVIDALERMIQHLKLYERTPANGLAAFSGNVSEREGQSDVQVWSIEPPVPMNQRLYRCDKEFILEPLHEMAHDENTYGMVVIDKREATIALLKGKTIVPLTTTTSAVPGKHKSGGQCLHPETLVQMADGTIVPIKEIEPGQLVLSVDKSGKIVTSEVLDKWETTKKQKYTINTKYPRMQLICSKDHLLLSQKDGLNFEPAEKLKEGELLVFPEHIKTLQENQVLEGGTIFSYQIPESGIQTIIKKRKSKKLSQKELGKLIGTSQTAISAFESNKIRLKNSKITELLAVLELTEKEVQLQKKKKLRLPGILHKKLSQIIGYYLGDGSRDQNRICFFEQREYLAQYYAKLLGEVFDTNVQFRYREEKNYYRIRINLSEGASNFFSNFPELKKAKDSRIPKKILASPKPVVRAFLKGLFDAEGSITSDKLTISMHNEAIIRSLQILLLRFRIISSYRTYDNQKNPYSKEIRHTLQITDKRSLKNFETLIGFTAKDKQQKLIAVCESKTEKSLQRQILASGKDVRALIEECGENLENFPKVNSFFRDERMMGKPTFCQSILQATPTLQLKKKLRQIVDQPLLPTTIQKIIAENKETQFVDISVEHQNFFANGLVVHNSAQRFERLRDGAAKEFYRRAAGYAKKEFFDNNEIKGLLIGGPGRSKEEFLEDGDLPQALKDKVIAIEDLSYTGTFGLHELLDKSVDALAEEDVMEEKKLMQRFFHEMSKDTGLAAYGKEEVMHMVKQGAADTLLLSESLDEQTIQEFEKEAESMGTDTNIISLETREGAQLKEIGKIAAILRYRTEY